MSLPPELVYQQPISNRSFGLWVGYCKGDQTHKQHLVIIKKLPAWNILHTETDIFRKPDGTTLAERLFERKQQLRCPVGKCYMALQKKQTEKLGMPTIDIYKCKGNARRSGHHIHYTRIQHGRLESKINGKAVRLLIVTLERK